MDKPIKILILEDRAEDAKLIKFELKNANILFESEVVDERRRFIEALDRYQPELILSDYALPQFTGLEAIRLVKQKCPEIPIIIVTGSINEETAVRCMKEGAWDYVLKGHLSHIRQAVYNVLQIKENKEKIAAAEQELAANEQRLNNLMSNLPGIAYRCRNDSKWTMNFISEGCEKLTGYKAEDFIDNKKIDFASIIHPQDRDFVWKIIQEAISKKQHYQLEYRIIDAFGRQRWFWEQGLAVCDKQDNVIALEGFISDISDRKLAGEALQKSRQLYKEQSELLNGVFDSIPDIMGVQDADRRIIRYNRSGYEFMNCTPDKALGQKCYSLIKRKAPCDECAVQKCFETKQPAHIEKYIPEKDLWLDMRSYPLLDEKGNIIKIIQHLRNITARKQTESKLMLSEERMKAIFRNAYDVIVIIDFKTGKILDVNSASKRLLNYEPTALIGKKFSVLFPPDEKKSRKDILQQIKIHGAVFESQPFQKADKSVCFMDITANEIPWNGFEVAMVTMRDITERMKAENELLESEKKFRTFAENVPGVISIYTWYPDGHVEFHYRGPGLAEIIGQELADKCQEDPAAFFRMIPREDLRNLEKEAAKAIENDEALDTEYRLEIAPEKYVWLRSRFRVVSQPDGSYLWQGIINEITKQKIIEQELIESEKLLNTTQQMAHVGSWIYNLISGEVYCSEEMLNILGSDAQKRKQKYSDFLQHIHPDDFSRVKKDFIWSLRKSTPYEIYHRIIRSDGKVRFIVTKTENLRSKEGQHIRSIGMSQDITDIVKTQEIIRQSEQLSMAIISESTLGISVRDKNGRLLMYNQTWKNIWSLSSKELQNYMQPRSTLKFDQRDNYLGEHRKEIEKIYRQGGDYVVPELKITKSKYGYKWISQRFYALMDENDQVERVVIISEDITSRKQAEETQIVLYNIANAANSAKNLDELFVETRNQLSRILDTTNFFIALYDEKTKMLSLPFMRDEKDFYEAFPAGRTLSGYVIETGQAQFITNSEADQMVEDDIVDRLGSPAAIWMGAPLKTKEKIIGVIVLQSYENEHLFSRKDLELLTFVSSEIASAIDHKRAEEEIKVQKTYFENLFQVSPDALVILSNDDDVIQINNEFTKLFGYKQDEVIDKNINDLIVPEELKKEAIEKTHAVSKGSKIQFEAVRQHKNGKRFMVEVIGKPVILGNNQLAVQTIYRDISIRKQHEQQILKDLEEKEILLKEVHHRVKNNMQVISSMLKLQSRYIQDEQAQEIFTNSQNRVKSMALIHERIYKSEDLASVNFEEYVRSLTSSLFANSGISGSRVSLQLNIKDINVNMNKAIPLGLIINELISNSFKHAFPDERKGLLSVSLTREKDKYRLIIADDGVGCPQDLNIQDPSTLGLQLINALAAQLHGKTSFISDGGTKFIMEF